MSVIGESRGGHMAGGIRLTGLLCASALLVLVAAAPLAAAPGISLISRPLVAGEGIGFKARRQASQALPVSGSLPAGIDMTRFSFTAPGKAAVKTSSVDRGFQFTPAGGDRRSVTVASSTRTSAPVPASATQSRAAAGGAAIGPESYGFDLAVAWKGLALSGGVDRTIGAAGAETEGVGLGLSYGKSSWRTGVRATAQRGSPLFRQSDSAATEKLAFEAMGALAVAPSVSLGGSVRYQMAPIHPTPLDPNKEDRAVFVGGRLAF